MERTPGRARIAFQRHFEASMGGAEIGTVVGIVIDDIFFAIGACGMCGDSDDYKKRLEQAAFIVRAVNCHERLVEAVKDYESMIEGKFGGDCKLCRILGTLIAEAEGGEGNG